MTDDRELERLLAELSVDELDLPAPPMHVWKSIEAAIAHGDAPEVDADVGLRNEPGEATVIGLSRRRSAWLLAAAAAIVAIVAGSFVALRGDTTDAEVLASADLAYDAAAFDPLGSESQAHADLVAADGEQSIELSDASLPTDIGDAELEVWLLMVVDGEVADLVSLGPLASDGDGSFVVPADVDTGKYSVVDISIEPHDGDPTHSGRSILRGQLNA